MSVSVLVSAGEIWCAFALALAPVATSAWEGKETAECVRLDDSVVLELVMLERGAWRSAADAMRHRW